MILGDLFAQLRFQNFQLGQPVGVLLHLRLNRLGLRQLGGVLFGLTHQHSHLFERLLRAARRSLASVMAALFCLSSSRTSSTSGSLAS
jgi:hypothetical protein